MGENYKSMGNEGESKVSEMITINKNVLKWLVSDDTGMSSLSLCASFFDLNRQRSYYPSDPSDFGRCKKFLKTLSAKDRKLALKKVSKLSPEWKALAAYWDHLDSLFNDCHVLYAAMKNVLKKAGG